MIPLSRVALDASRRPRPWTDRVTCRFRLLAIRTRRRWSPNVQKKRVYSELLERMIPMRVTTKALRCMDKAGGLDEYILKTRDDKLASEFAIALKAQLRAALRAKEASGAATESVVDFGAGAGAA